MPVSITSRFFSSDPQHEVRITKGLSAHKDLVLLQLISFFSKTVKVAIEFLKCDIIVM